LLRLAKAGVNIVTAHVIKCQLKRDQERHQGLFHIIKQPVIMETGRKKKWTELAVKWLNVLEVMICKPWTTYRGRC